MFHLNRPSSASNQSEVPVLVLSLKLPFFTLGERGAASSYRHAQGYIFMSNLSNRNQDPAPKAALLFPSSSSLVPASTPFSDQHQLEPAFWNAILW